MNTKHDDFDALLRDTLAEDEQALTARLGEPSLLDMVVDVYRGRLRWLVWVTMVVTAVFFGLGIYCAVRFFQAPELREMIQWGAGFFFCMTAVMANKIFAWMEMERGAIVREIKRLEVRIVQMQSTLSGGSGAAE